MDAPQSSRYCPFRYKRKLSGGIVCTVRRSILAFALGAVSATLSACTDRVTVYIAPPWSKDQLVVLVTLDAYGAIVDSEPHVYSGADTIELDLPPDRPSRLLARLYPGTLTGPDGTPARDCGIKVQSTNTLQDPSSAWITPVIDGSSEDVSFSIDVDQHASSVPLGFSQCERTLNCDGYSMTLLSLEPHIQTHRAAIVDSSLAYFAARHEIDPGGDPTVFVSVTGTMATVLPDSMILQGSPDNMIWDPAGWMWIVSGGVPRRYTRDLTPLTQPRIERIKKVHVGVDGTRMFLSKDGVVFEESNPSTTGYAAQDFFPPDVSRMDVVRSDRVAALASSSIYFFDGTTWHKEHDVSLLENVSAIGGDADVFAVGGEIENVRVRNEAMGIWDGPLVRPFDKGLRIRVVDGAGGGRFIVAGDSGAVAVWTGSTWCVAGYAGPVTLVDMSVDPQGRYAYLAGDDEVGIDGQSVLVRVDMPPP